MHRFASALSIWTLLPAAPTLDAYARVLDLPLFARQLANTVVLGAFVATATTLTSVFAACALARPPMRGRGVVFGFLLPTLFVPVDVVLPPLFFVVRDLGLIDDFRGLAPPFVFSPIGVHLLRQTIQEVPRELDQACMLDGGGAWEALRTAILPNIRGALIACWLMHFVFFWERYLRPLAVMRRDGGQLAQVAIAGLADPLRSADYALVFAAAVLAILPAFATFALLQRFLTASHATTGGR